MDDSNLREWLLELERSLNYAVRLGAEIDRPEGQRYIHVSDTLARALAAGARHFADQLQQG